MKFKIFLNVYHYGAETLAQFHYTVNIVGKYVIGARLLELWAYKQGDARRKDRELCFAHSLVLS